ncbi:uncharacterized protein BKA55DRAFT_548696 [Fusarium redolens]|uniref:Uncharacterized protein n=1 Tax=Fusarium redolens TaxID=48865 RepID=A0A9P9KW74_FUSRE|nr:uncharacterized protein BKA55DRAFT_548696 [Fusarium redolens]KAH7269480.1 hypothetical protein BKA55DRAFT_548696 [Fusarium redolens]
MEPPTKKRRRGSSAQKEVRGESDDDELASHPQEIRMRRDPDIQLALKRANADHKLQATMAHIIEKYSRDFEGIGDEIDMNTGEIVVNNGHLRNMRDEGDVEGLWMEGDSNIDEDEGLLLEDLTDGYSDSEEPVKGVQHSQNDNQNSQKPTFAEQGAPTSQKTHSKVAPEAPQTDMDRAMDPSQIPNVMLPPSEPHFGPPPYGPGSSVGFGPTPGFGPWGMMHGFPMQAWDRDDIPPYFNMPPSMPGPWFSGGRYVFPTHNGQTSIWSRNQAKKTKRAGSMKASSKQATNRHPNSSRTEEEADADDHHKSMSEKQPPDNQEVPAPDRTINDTDDDDDLMFSEATEVASTPEASLVLPTKETSPAKGEVHRHPQGVLKETNGNAVKVPQQNDEEDGSGRRRSGRARKQTEYLGKISWDDAREWQRSGQSLRVELYKVDPVVRKDFESVNHVGDECVSSSVEFQGNALRTKGPERGTTSQRQVVPDSQDTATPFNSSASEAPEPTDGNDRLNASDIPTVPSMELSDDEAPLVLSRIRAPKRQIDEREPLSPLISTQGRNRSAEPTVPVASSSPKPNRRAAPIIDRAVGGMLDQSIEPLKRKRGRPKGSTRKAQNGNAVSSMKVITKGPTAPQRHDAGTPKKSYPANPDIEVRFKDHSTYGTRSHGCPDREEETQQTSDDDHTETEGRPITHHLTSELKWLLKTKPKSPAAHRSQAKTSDESIKLRRSREKLQKPSHGTNESMEVNEDIAVGQEEQPVPQKPHELLQEPNTILEGSMEKPATVVIVGDEQSPTASPSSTVHVDRPSNYSDPPDDSESRLNDNSSDYAPPHDEAVHDDESLPELPHDTMVQGVSTPRKPKDTRTPLTEPPSSSHKPHTPRHASIRTTRAPSSRRSLLSFVSDSESDTSGSRDELARRVKSTSKAASVRPSTKRIWRASALTREIQRTPSRKRVHEMSSPINTVKTPGGTLWTCGVDGYQCGRDFCFTCI